MVLFIGHPVLADDALPVSMVGCLSEYHEFVEEKGGDPLAITEFQSSLSNRCVVSFVLMQQALRLGGITAPLTIVTAPSSNRAKKMVAEGEVALAGNELWKEFFDEHVLMTVPVVKKGQFFKVICGRADNQGLLNIKTLDDLKGKVAVTGHDCIVDMKVLQKMGAGEIYRVSRFDSQLEMIKAGRVDFGIFELTALKNKGCAGINNIVPVRGVMVRMDSSRHYMVSRTHPDGERVLAALNKGLDTLCKQGIIKKAMLDSGFFNPTVSNWRVIYPEKKG